MLVNLYHLLRQIALSKSVAVIDGASLVTEKCTITLSALQTKTILHYENMPIQIYWKFTTEKIKIFR